MFASKYSCGGRHYLAHPPSQDISTSDHHTLINTDTTVANASENCKVETVRCETGKQLTRGLLQKQSNLCLVIYTYTTVIA